MTLFHHRKTTGDRRVARRRQLRDVTYWTPHSGRAGQRYWTAPDPGREQDNEFVITEAGAPGLFTFSVMIRSIRRMPDGSLIKASPYGVGDARSFKEARRAAYNFHKMRG